MALDKTQALLAENLSRLMDARGMNHDELAKRAKLGKIELLAFMWGDRSPDIDDLAELAKALEVEPAELLTPPSASD